MMVLSQADSNDAEHLKRTLDSLQTHLAVLDQTGMIVFTNHAWRAFATENGLAADYCGPGISYLQVCDDAIRLGCEESVVAKAGIQAVLSGTRPDFYMEYPCHSPDSQRWFSLRVTRFEIHRERRIVVAHENITARKLVELALQAANERLEHLSLTDSLTGVGNRRNFQQTFEIEWKRHQRMSLPISVAMIDVDFFKKFNDSCGHLAGDECLRAVAQAIQTGIRRPGDFVARYGGEEFVVILPNTPAEGAVRVAGSIQHQLRDLKIAHPNSPISPYLTISLGIASVIPARINLASTLLEAADKAMYQAKALGRDRFTLYAPDALTVDPSQ